jgi:hypothetical protein
MVWAGASDTHGVYTVLLCNWGVRCMVLRLRLQIG